MAVTASVLFLFVTVTHLFFLLRKQDGQFHMPFFMLCVSGLYIGLQLLIFSLNEGRKYPLEITFFVFQLFLANLLTHVGFYSALKTKNKSFVATMPQTGPFWSHNYFIYFPIFLILSIAYFSFLQLGSLAGGMLNFLTHQGDAVEWTGVAVYYSFFVALLQILFPCTLYMWWKSKNPIMFFCLVASLFILMLYVLMLNRRSIFFIVVCTFWCFGYFTGTFRARKRAIILGLPIALLVLQIFPLLRSANTLAFEIARTGVTPVELILGRAYGEAKNGVLVTFTTLLEGNYQYGLSFVKQLFKDFVPSALIGRELKYSMLGNEPYIDSVLSTYAFTIPGNEFITGIAWLFTQFGLISPFFWFLLAYLVGVIYKRSVLKRQIFAVIVYTCIVPTSMLALYFSPAVALNSFIKISIVVGTLYFFQKLVIRN